MICICLYVVCVYAACHDMFQSLLALKRKTGCTKCMDGWVYVLFGLIWCDEISGSITNAAAAAAKYPHCQLAVMDCMLKHTAIDILSLTTSSHRSQIILCNMCNSYWVFPVNPACHVHEVWCFLWIIKDLMKPENKSDLTFLSSSTKLIWNVL